MDKLDPQDGENIDNLKRRIEYLEKGSQWYFFAFEILAGLGDLHKDINKNQDPSYLIHCTQKLLKQLIRFKAMAFYLIEESDSSFYMKECEPLTERSSLKREVDEQIENGTFAWALKQNRPLIIGDDPIDAKLVFHSLTTQTRPWGMFVGKIEGNLRRVPKEQLNLISIILQNTAYALENGALQRLFCNQNWNLELALQERNNELNVLTKELKEEAGERKKAERKLDSFNAQKESILISGGDGVLGLDPQGKLVSLHPKDTQTIRKKGKSGLQFYSMPDKKYKLSLNRLDGDNSDESDLWVLNINPHVKKETRSSKFLETSGLTTREMEVCYLIRDGVDEKIISQKLGISYQTVKTHIKNIHKKLGVRSRTQLLTTLNQ